MTQSWAARRTDSLKPAATEPDRSDRHSHNVKVEGASGICLSLIKGEESQGADHQCGRHVDGIEAAHPGLSGKGGGEISKTTVAFDYRKASPVLGKEVLAHQSLRGTVDKGEATFHFDLCNARRRDKVGASNHRARLVRPVLSEVARQQDRTVEGSNVGRQSRAPAQPHGTLDSVGVCPRPAAP